MELFGKRTSLLRLGSNRIQSQMIKFLCFLPWPQNIVLVCQFVSYLVTRSTRRIVIHNTAQQHKQKTNGPTRNWNVQGERSIVVGEASRMTEHVKVVPLSLESEGGVYWILKVVLHLLWTWTFSQRCNHRTQLSLITLAMDHLLLCTRVVEYN